ncbi:MAG: hypothetical protein EU536_03380 [Promethearchaeota archaeon]|nr:MAG: hypothetical protein EU536_03380 [Candidatus Lokiarchaeota archaeon]
MSEISKFIKDALKDGSIEKVSKGIEQLVIMMINAVGMMEQTQLDLTQRIESIEEDLEVIKSFLLSTPIPLPGSTAPPSTPQTGSNHIESPSIILSSPAHEPTPQETPIPTSQLPECPIGPPSEDDITEFRKKLLKPTPKTDLPKSKPISIRGALLQEMKEYFGSAMTEVDKEKKDAD